MSDQSLQFEPMTQSNIEALIAQLQRTYDHQGLNVSVKIVDEQIVAIPNNPH